MKQLGSQRVRGEIPSWAIALVLYGRDGCSPASWCRRGWWRRLWAVVKGAGAADRRD